MPATGTTPRLPEILRKYASKAVDGVHVALPGKVLAYDPTTQKAVVEVAVKLEKPDGELSSVPPLGGVPVAFPSGGTFSIVWPLVPGDSVLVVFCSASIEDWLLEPPGAIEPNEPRSNRRHGLSDAVAIPGLRSFTNPIVPQLPTALEIGDDVTKIVIDPATGKVKLGSALASDPVALSSLVLAELQAIKTIFDAHTHAGVTTGTGVSAVPATPLTPPTAPAATKIDGV